MADLIIAGSSVPLIGADRKPASGLPQYFTSGNPGASIPATIWPAYAANMIVSELRNLVAAGGMTPDGDAWDQCREAILSLSHFTDTGGVNTIVVTPNDSLPVSGLRLGQIIHVTVAATNTGVTSLTFGGHAANVLRPNGGSLLQGDVVAGRTYQFVFNGTYWILHQPIKINTLAGNPNGVLAGIAGAPGQAPDFCWDTTSNNLWVCTGTGIPGVWATCVSGSVDHGGTGKTSLDAGSVLVGNGTSPIAYAAPGTAGIPLISNGAGVAPSFTPLDVGGAGVSGLMRLEQTPVSIIAVYPTPGVTSYTPNAYQHWLYGEVTGGGGGGAGENTGGPFTGGGGGAGGYACGWFPCTPGVAITITVGAGGAFGPGTSDGSGNGTSGGSSSIGAFMSATGGQGGQSSTNAAGGAGGVGSAPSGGMQTRGGYGGDGDIGGDEIFAGNGGASYWGGGVRAARGSPPSDAAAFGGGGGGAYFGAATASAGMPGVVILRG